MRKWWIVILSILLLIIFLCFGVLFIDQFANYPSVINARNWYQNTYISMVGKLLEERGGVPKYSLPYTFQVQPWMDRYVYTLYGTLIEANEDKKQLLINGDDGKDYVIKPSKWLMRDLGWDYKAETAVFEQEYLQLDTMPMVEGDRIRVMWDDEGKLAAMKRNYRDNPGQPINIGFVRFFFFTHQNK
jgi:hypothetical protein